MTYTLRPSIQPRERILTFGVQGTGKSTAILKAARRCPDAMFHVLDSEIGNYDRLLATGFTDLTNVDVTVIEEWPEFIDGVKSINAKMERDDWLVIDSITPSWDAVQAWFIDQVHGVDIAEFFVEKRKAMQDIREAASKSGAQAPKGFAAINGEDGDWQVINKLYFPFYNQILKCPGHVYLTAEQDKLGKDDEKDIKAAFGPYGVKPKGQKKLPKVPHTVLWLTKSRIGEWAITTIKDRERLEFEDEAMGDFASQYLMKVAGWRPTKIGDDGS